MRAVKIESKAEYTPILDVYEVKFSLNVEGKRVYTISMGLENLGYRFFEVVMELKFSNIGDVLGTVLHSLTERVRETRRIRRYIQSDPYIYNSFHLFMYVYNMKRASDYQYTKWLNEKTIKYITINPLTRYFYPDVNTSSISNFILLR